MMKTKINKKRADNLFLCLSLLNFAANCPTALFFLTFPSDCMLDPFYSNCTWETRRLKRPSRPAGTCHSRALAFWGNLSQVCK